MYQTLMSKKGQVVVPKVIRDALNIEASDKLYVTVEQGKIVMEPVTRLSELYGTFKAKQPLSKENVKKVIRNGIGKKFIKLP